MASDTEKFAKYYLFYIIKLKVTHTTLIVKMTRCQQAEIMVLVLVWRTNPDNMGLGQN